MGLLRSKIRRSPQLYRLCGVSLNLEDICCTVADETQVEYYQHYCWISNPHRRRRLQSVCRSWHGHHCNGDAHPRVVRIQVRSSIRYLRVDPDRRFVLCAPRYLSQTLGEQSDASRSGRGGERIVLWRSNLRFCHRLVESELRLQCLHVGLAHAPSPSTPY